MATLNPFDLLGADDAEDPSQLIAAQQPKKSPAPSAKPASQAKLPSKPLPPTQAVREAKSESGRGGRGGGRGYARGRGAGGVSYRDSSNNENSFGNKEVSAGPDREKTSDRHGGYRGPRGPFRGGRRGGFSNGEMGEGDNVYSRRPFERHSGTGRGNEIKREGAGRGNWGTQTDDLAQVNEEAVTEDDKSLNPYADKPSGEEDAAADGDKEAATNKDEEKEPENKEMTLEEYEKVLEEKRKALVALKVSEQRKVDVKEFESMQQLANKKANEDIFIKLGSEKEKKKELAEKEERAKKSVSINEFLKPSEGDRYHGGGRGRGRGRGFRGGYGGGSETSIIVKAPSIEDPGQFPTLGGTSKTRTSSLP